MLQNCPDEQQAEIVAQRDRLESENAELRARLDRLERLLQQKSE